MLKVLNDYYQTRLSIASYWDFTERYAGGESLVGYATVRGGLEPGMWRPWGHGRVERILVTDTPDEVRDRGIRAAFVDDDALSANEETLEHWLERFHATLVHEISFTTDPGAPRSKVYFVRLAPPGPPAGSAATRD